MIQKRNNVVENFWIWTFWGLGSRKVSRESNSVVRTKASFLVSTSNHDFDHGGADWAFLQEYPNFGRRTEYYTLSLIHPDGFCWKVLPQEALIKFVRQTPKLRGSGAI
jgi:hypothetical protein